MVCLKINVGFRVCLSDLGPVTGNEKGFQWIREEHDLAHAYLDVCLLDLRESSLLCSHADGVHMPAGLLGLLPAFA